MLAAKAARVWRHNPSEPYSPHNRTSLVKASGVSEPAWLRFDPGHRQSAAFRRCKSCADRSRSRSAPSFRRRRRCCGSGRRNSGQSRCTTTMCLRAKNMASMRGAIRARPVRRLAGSRVRSSAWQTAWSISSTRSFGRHAAGARKGRRAPNVCRQPAADTAKVLHGGRPSSSRTLPRRFSARCARPAPEWRACGPGPGREESPARGGLRACRLQEAPPSRRSISRAKIIAQRGWQSQEMTTSPRCWSRHPACAETLRWSRCARNCKS